MKKFLVLSLTLVVLLFSCSLDSDLAKNSKESSLENNARGLVTVAVDLIPLGSGVCDANYIISAPSDPLSTTNVTLTWSDGYVDSEYLPNLAGALNVYGVMQRRGMIPGRYQVQITGTIVTYNGSGQLTPIWSQYEDVK